MRTPTPDAAVLDGFANTPDDALFLSALTLGEIRKGVEKRRLWLEHDLRDWFGRRIGRDVVGSRRGMSYLRFDCRHSGG